MPIRKVAGRLTRSFRCAAAGQRASVAIRNSVRLEWPRPSRPQPRISIGAGVFAAARWSTGDCAAAAVLRETSCCGRVASSSGSAARARGGASRAVRTCKGMLLCTCVRHHPLRPVFLCATAYPPRCRCQPSLLPSPRGQSTIRFASNFLPNHSVHYLSQFPEICQWFLSRTTYSTAAMLYHRERARSRAARRGRRGASRRRLQQLGPVHCKGGPKRLPLTGPDSRCVHAVARRARRGDAL